MIQNTMVGKQNPQTKAEIIHNGIGIKSLINFIEKKWYKQKALLRRRIFNTE